MDRALDRPRQPRHKIEKPPDLSVGYITIYSMSAIDLLQFLAQALFVLIFVVVTIKAVRRPLRANVDTALLFGVTAAIITEGAVTAALRVEPGRALAAVVGSLLMALPYLLLRLVDDFSAVPRLVMRGAAAGLALAVVSLAVVPPSVHAVWLTLLYVAYFLGLSVYVAIAFVRAARRSSGVTGRRLQAVALGTLCLGLAILVIGLQAAVPALTIWWVLLDHLCSLGTALGYFVGFAPPAWLRRAWQEPEMRAFLGRAARLPRLPDTRAIVRELEHGAASSLGAPHASVLLWDEQTGLLHAEIAGRRVELPSGYMAGGRAFAQQRPLFLTDAARDDPDHADLYRAYQANAVLAAPITAGEQRLGVLLIYAARASIFAEDDLGLARLLADQAAVILESRALIDEAARVRAREEATRLKDDFLSAAAHDLKTPLTTLLGQAQLLEMRARRDPAAPADPRGIGRIVAEAQRLKRLVLDVSRVEQGKLVGPREEIDLVAAARETCARQSSQRHRCVVDAAGPVAGLFDPVRVMQLLDNLVENALKYSPEGGEVRVRVRVWRGRVHTQGVYKLILPD